MEAVKSEGKKYFDGDEKVAVLLALDLIKKL